MKSNIQAQIDDLYGLPLDEFTKARNALAKTLAGSEKQAVASLVKPSLAMWVINQLYWHNKPTYQALVDASEKLRAAHRAALSGRATDTRKAGELHKTTLEKAFAQSIGAAEKKGVHTTDAVRDTVRRTLAALPTDEAPGRITREPPPAGFSLLTGIKPQAIDRAKPRSPVTLSTASSRPSPAEVKRLQVAAQKADQVRKEEARKAKQAEEKARKDQAKRAREIEKAEQALKEAERRLAELKR
jgi:hypothetical protein